MISYPPSLQLCAWTSSYVFSVWLRGRLYHLEVCRSRPKFHETSVCNVAAYPLEVLHAQYDGSSHGQVALLTSVKPLLFDARKWRIPPTKGPLKNIMIIINRCSYKAENYACVCTKYCLLVSRSGSCNLSIQNLILHSNGNN